MEFGWLIRSVHHWAANGMIIALVLHVLRVFLQAAYKYPRELTWVFGVGLLAVTIGFGFTGYLLPWDQKAFWATTVGTEIAWRFRSSATRCSSSCAAGRTSRTRP